MIFWDGDTQQHITVFVLFLILRNFLVSSSSLKIPDKISDCIIIINGEYLNESLFELRKFEFFYLISLCLMIKNYNYNIILCNLLYCLHFDLKCLWHFQHLCLCYLYCLCYSSLYFFYCGMDLNNFTVVIVFNFIVIVIIIITVFFLLFIGIYMIF